MTTSSSSAQVDLAVDDPVTSPGPHRARALPLGGHLLRLLGQTAAVVIGVVVTTFFLVRLIPGDATSVILGPTATPEARAALREQLNLNGSLLDQFTGYVGQLLHGDLGSSVVSPSLTVSGLLGDALPVTLSVVGTAIVVALVMGIPLGLLAGLRRGATDAGIRGLLTLVLTMPPFFFGLVLLAVFAGLLGVLPAGGWGQGWPDNSRYVVLPGVALAAYLMPLVARSVRQSTRDALSEPWVEVLLARGTPPADVAVRHVLPVALLPVITLLGYNAGALLAGAVVVESVFGIPGLGQLLVTAMSQRDYPIIQGVALVGALVVVATNVAADLLSLWVDPRGRTS